MPTVTVYHPEHPATRSPLPATTASSSSPHFAKPARTLKQATLSSLAKPYARPASRKSAPPSPPPASPFVLDREPPPFPRTPTARAAFRRDLHDERYCHKPAAKITPFQWRVYDTLLTIPSGRLTTYGHLAALLSSSPRGVGAALRNNPFAPFVPCHRVIASTLYIGGFGGEWVKEGKGKGGRKEGEGDEGRRTAEKIELLRREGVLFDSKGYLRDQTRLWDGKEKVDVVEVITLEDES
ncbi:hypothetical protein Rhopal_000572-T1 [Rhodotorula paludigena]|uniref:Methylated-DNA--protein-cysteine methyltransferase n=1 Tax=Rhodotorula paludigena TaxID=86838 RepID=A0AAV5GE67_9BASI|nr:hypothetical protein Rhopal_000572-T1 [Rhodotorula paludigena]